MPSEPIPPWVRTAASEIVTVEVAGLPQEYAEDPVGVTTEIIARHYRLHTDKRDELLRRMARDAEVFREAVSLGPLDAAAQYGPDFPFDQYLDDMTKRLDATLTAYRDYLALTGAKP